MSHADWAKAGGLFEIKAVHVSNTRFILYDQYVD
ncbi:hypothetical protein VCD_003535 [Vibrio cholerae MJ-1236]|nr:hypothetical protein VCD_003535 [Vibrio cholerae MJ-1236]